MTSDPVRVLPTIFDGIKYRSRTEARWAVFFKEIGAKFYYELEGFPLQTGWYLPDFFLPEMDLFIEVKPFWAPQIAFQKARELSEYTKMGVMLACGPPDPDRFDIVFGDGEIIRAQLAHCRRCSGHALMLKDDGGYSLLGHHADLCGDRWPVAIDRRPFDRALTERFGT